MLHLSYLDASQNLDSFFFQYIDGSEYNNYACTSHIFIFLFWSIDTKKIAILHSCIMLPEMLYMHA